MGEFVRCKIGKPFLALNSWRNYQNQNYTLILHTPNREQAFIGGIVELLDAGGKRFYICE